MADDVYLEASANVALKPVGSDWALDGDPDCTDAIDGWYYDGMDEEDGVVSLNADKRWEAHADSYDDIYAKLYEVDGATTVTGPLALKAAHGLGTVAVDPADITIYMGGTEGYEGVISDLDNGTFDASNSLPEPGFYFVLPDDINQAFEDAGIAPKGEAADLSQYMRIYTHGYTVDDQPVTLNWKLEKYGKTNSGANGQFIYRIVPDPTEGQEAVPVRLQFTDANGKVYTSDEFNPATAGALNQHYTMQLYTALVDADQVVFEVDVPGIDGSTAKYYNGMELQTGDLNIRYVTGDQDDVVTKLAASEDEVAENAAKNPGKAYALTSEDATFTINGSQVDVTDSAAPSLLFDDVVSDHSTEGAADYDQQLANRTVDVAAAEGTTFVKPQYQAKYLDLVDANNGNVWLTSSSPVTVYWPYPAGTDESTDFTLVHFKGLNREMANGEVSGNIANADTEVLDVENTPYGIKFTTDGFSPFVLMWETATAEEPTPAPEEPKPVLPVTPETPETPVDDSSDKTEEKPAAGLPGTGDASAVAGIVAAAGAAVLGGAAVLRKRRE